MSSRLKDESDLLKSFLSSNISNSDSSTDIFRNYVLFCVTFSITHATVDSVLSYATAELGKELGGYSSGILYLLYAFTSIFFAKAFISWKGTKTSIIIGVFSLLMYVTTFSLAIAFPSIQWYLCIPGSIIGGIGAGFMWTAQSAYYSQSANLYAKCTNTEIDTIHNEFAAYFAFIYLATEAFGKSFITGVYLLYGDGNWQLYAFVIYSAIAWLSAFACCTISDLDVRRASSNLSVFVVVSKEISSVFSLIQRHPTFYLMLPYQLSFGFGASYISYYVDGIILNDSGKEGYIGVLSALSIVIASVIAFPLYTYSNSFGKHDVMVFGAMCFGGCTSVLLFFKNHFLSQWTSVIPLISLYGMGRGIWENTNKALLTDVFSEEDKGGYSEAVAEEVRTSVSGRSSSYIGTPAFLYSLTSLPDDSLDEDKEVAFATIYFASGIAGAIGYFLYPHITRQSIALINVALAIMSMTCNHFLCKKMTK